MAVTNFLLRLMALLVLFSPAGCASYKQVLDQRDGEILAEESGDYYIGRRYYVLGTRFWGYLRRPQAPWETAQLVIFNEVNKKQPDRLPESPAEGPKHGFDHNSEYRIFGSFTGDRVYDPNSNFVLPEFMLRDYELITRKPGFLFHPKDEYHPQRLPTRL